MANADWAEAAVLQEQYLVQDFGDMKVNASNRAKDGGTDPLKNNITNDDEEKEPTAAERSLLQKLFNKGLVENKNDVEVQRRKPESPLHSVKSFEDLPLRRDLLKGIYSMGFFAPSKIQGTTLPMLLADPPHNMVAQSQSGTGKTAAFVLTMLSRVDVSKPYPQVLCLSPTYELALQTGDVASKMSQHAKEITIRYAVRGETIPRGSKITDHIIIGTPGKSLDWALKYRFFDIKKIRVFVLDEADVMIATQGHRDQSIRIRKELSPDCQMLFFSATYDQEVMDFAKSIVPDPEVLRLRREEESLDNIGQYWVDCPSQESKYKAIDNIYSVITIGQAIIFCQTKKTAAWLSSKLKKDGHAVSLLSGDLTIEERIQVLDRFRQGMEKILISTNVMSRGIDVAQVTIVVNYDLPVDVSGKADCETYLHRIGRTGRFGKRGLAINLIDGERSMAIMQVIQEHFGKPIVRLNAEDYEEIEKIEK